MPSPLYEGASHSFERLRSIRLRLDGLGTGPSPGQQEMLPKGFAPALGALRGLLASASSSLEDLAITQHEDSSASSETVCASPFMQCVENNTFLKLRRLALGCVSFTPEGLSEFVRRHQATLRQVSIVDGRALVCARFEGVAVKYESEVFSDDIVGSKAAAVALRSGWGMELPLLHWDDNHDGSGHI